MSKLSCVLALALLLALVGCASRGAIPGNASLKEHVKAMTGVQLNAGESSTPAFTRIPYPNGFAPTILALAAGTDGNEWFTDTSEQYVGFVASGSAWTVSPVPPFILPPSCGGGMAVAHPFSLRAGPDGLMYFLGLAGYGTISTTSPLTLYTTESCGTSDVGIPELENNFVVVPNSIVWFPGTNSSNNNFALLQAQLGNVLGQFVPSPSSNIDDVAMGADGNLWFSDNALNLFGKFDLNSHVITEFNFPKQQNSTGFPGSLILGPDGNVYGSHCNTTPFNLFRISTSGMVHAIDVNHDTIGVNCVDTSNDMTIGGDNALWYNGGGGDIIERFTLTGQSSDYTVPNPDPGQGGVASISAAPDGNIWFWGPYKGIGVFHMHTISTKPESLRIAIGKSGKVAVAELKYARQFDATTPPNCPTPTTTNGKTFTVSAAGTKGTCIYSFADEVGVATVYVPVTTH